MMIFCFQVLVGNFSNTSCHVNNLRGSVGKHRRYEVIRFQNILDLMKIRLQRILESWLFELYESRFDSCDLIPRLNDSNRKFESQIAMNRGTLIWNRCESGDSCDSTDSKNPKF